MTRKTGVTDEVNLIQESGSTDITNTLGNVQSAGWDIKDPADSAFSVGGGAQAQQFVDGLIIPNVSLSVAVPDLSVMQLMGSLSGGAVTLDDTLPKHTLKFQATSTEVLEVTGVKWGRAVVNIARDDFITVDFEGIGTDFSFDTNTISTSLSSDDVLTYLDAEYKIGGTTVGSVDSASITYDRSLDAVRGIESTSAGSKRLPSELIEKIKDITSDATIQITDDTAWKEVHGDGSLPVVPQDSRSTTSVAIDTGDGGEFQLTSGKFQSEKGKLSNDNDIRTVDVSFTGQNGSVSGIV